MPIAPEIMFVIALVALVLAMVWGIIRYMTRNKANDAITEEATRAQKQMSTEDYDREREQLKKQLKP